jgi:hypothetical protein
MRRQVLQELPMYGDLHRFIPIFASRRGYAWCEVPLPQQPGKHEVGAFSPRSYVRRFLDLLTLAFLTHFVERPLHFFGPIGGASVAVGAVIGAWLWYRWAALGEAVGHHPLLLLAALLIVVGVQVGSIGLLGELMVFTQARRADDYAIREIAG